MKFLPRNYYLNELFDDLMVPEDNKMKCDIYEKDDAYHVEMDIPGFKKDEITIDVNDSYLTITAEKKEETNDETKKYIRRERVYGKYQRSFYLGDANTDDVTAKFEHGSLKIVVPKKEMKETKKVIEIED